MPELLIRPSYGDHLVLEDLLAPSLLHQTRPIDRVVLSAHDAARDERLPWRQGAYGPAGTQSRDSWANGPGLGAAGG